MLTQMYPTILSIHSYWRWVVLIAALAAVIAAVVGLVQRRSFAPVGRKTGVIYVAALDMQLLIGLLLYAASPTVRIALSNMAAAMKAQELRFFAVEHLVIMLVAVALAHVGSVRAKRASEDSVKYRRQLVWFTSSLIVILVGIPWWRPLLPGLVSP